MIDAQDRLRRLVMRAARGSGAARLLAPALSGIGAILMLHSVTARPGGPMALNDHLSVTPDFLDRVLAHMKGRYRFVAMDELAAHLASGSRAPVCCITADDGYRDNLLEALPVLESHDAPFTVYIAPGLTEGTVEPWWELAETMAWEADRIVLPAEVGGGEIGSASPAGKREAARRLLRLFGEEVGEGDRDRVLAQMRGSARAYTPLMDWPEIERLAAHPLATIGAHTLGHRNLARLGPREAADEMSRSADEIERRLGARPRHFAYPYGHERAVGPREVGLARDAGFQTAVTTRHGLLHRAHATHLHALPRISLNGRYQEIGFVETMLTGFTALVNSRRRVVTV